MKTITCERCGKQEERATNARFCYDCAYARQKELTCKAQRRRSKGIPNIKHCKLCGKEFTAKGNQQYCSRECADAVYKEQQKRYYVSTLKARRKRAKK